MELGRLIPGRANSKTVLSTAVQFFVFVGLVLVHKQGQVPFYFLPMNTKSKFNSIDLNQIKTLVLRGFTDEEISKFYNINRTTFHNWKLKHKSFYDSLKDWKLEADAKVERSLYERAVGAEYDEIVREKVQWGDKISEEDIKEIKSENLYKIKVTTKKIIPDVTAQIFWLKNRQPEVWKDRQEHNHGLNEQAMATFGQIVKDVFTAAKMEKKHDKSRA